jgi:predicted outer membrane protein
VGATRDERPELDRLRRLKGGDFDREFVRRVAAEHKDLTDQLADARARTADPDLVALVDAVLPTERQHLATAQQLQTGVAKGP